MNPSSNYRVCAGRELHFMDWGAGHGDAVNPRRSPPVSGGDSCRSLDRRLRSRSTSGAAMKTGMITQTFAVSRTVRLAIGSVGMALAFAGHAQVVSSVSGANAAAIQATVDAFRGSLGPLNPNVAGSFGSGRREINWDGVPDTVRGAEQPAGEFLQRELAARRRLLDAGHGFQVSANAGHAAAVEFGNINPTYPSLFAPFSAAAPVHGARQQHPRRQFLRAGRLDAGADARLRRRLHRRRPRGHDVAAVLRRRQRRLGDLLCAGLGRRREAVVPRRAVSDGRVVRPACGSPAATSIRRRHGRDAATDLVAMDDFIYGEPVAAIAASPNPGPGR